MYIIVSKDPRIPLDLENGFQTEQWTPDEFLTRATSDEGIYPDEGIWYDVSDLTQEIYEGLNLYTEAGFSIIYYQFDDRPTPSFSITEDIRVYATGANDEPEEDEEPVVQNSAPQPQVQQPMQQDLYMNQTPQTQDIYAQQMQDPYMAQQQMYGQPPMQNGYMPQQPAYGPQPSYIPPMQQVPPTPTVPKTPNMQQISEQQMKDNMHNMLQYDDYDAGDRNGKRKAAPAKVILYGSSKGGSGKTTSCLFTAYWYAKSHPTEKIAIADFDIIDGQIGITINKLTPTMQDYYKLYNGGRRDFQYLDNFKVKSDKFTPNVDFYLAPSQDIPKITNDVEFWNDIFQKLITNYDVVFFDSGIDYIGKPPISQLYKIADHIIITCNTSINSTKSVIKQFKTLSGSRLNNVFRPGDDILSKVKVVLTRMSDMEDVNNIVIQNLSQFAPIVAQFGQIDAEISRVQWYQMWNTIDSTPKIVDQLNSIIENFD